MDTLSQLLNDLHLQGAQFRYLTAHSPWDFSIKTQGVASFQLVLSGEAHLYIAGKAVQKLGPGDMVVISNGHDAILADTSDRVDFTQLPDIASELADGSLPPLDVGGTGNASFLLVAKFQFDAEMAKPLLAALPPFFLLRGESEMPPPWLRIGLEFLAQEGNDRPGRQAIINRVADVLWIECVRDFVESLPEGSNSWLLALRDPALSRVLAAMHKDPAAAWTVPDLANLACMSRSAFADRFSHIMGRPPLSYLAEHRMRLAAWHLTHTRAPICHIAEKVGYASETAFSQAFKRNYQLSPSRFRQNQE